MDRGISGLSSLLSLFFSHLREAAVSGLGLPQDKFYQQRLAKQRRPQATPAHPPCLACPAISCERKVKSPTSSSPVIQRIPVGAPAIREISRPMSRGRTDTLFPLPMRHALLGKALLAGWRTVTCSNIVSSNCFLLFYACCCSDC